jgi:hypothetical protein
MKQQDQFEKLQYPNPNPHIHYSNAIRHRSYNSRHCITYFATILYWQVVLYVGMNQQFNIHEGSVMTLWTNIGRNSIPKNKYTGTGLYNIWP